MTRSGADARRERLYAARLVGQRVIHGVTQENGTVRRLHGQTASNVIVDWDQHGAGIAYSRDLELLHGTTPSGEQQPS